MTSMRKPKIPADQKTFLHGHHIGLERFAEQLFGSRYKKSADRIDIQFWKSFYISTFEVLDASIFPSIGSIDEPHKNAIQHELDKFSGVIKGIKSKDEIHSVLILSLLRLVFLLLGREPYKARGKRRNLSTFRTLTYSQSQEQMSWLLQGHIQRNAQMHGFGDSFDADYAFLTWCRENKKQNSDRSAYVEWVRLKFPETYRKFK